jgi:hypothetical protein
VTGVDGGLDPSRGDLDDAGLTVLAVGDHPGLAAGERVCRVAEVGDRHCQHGHRDAFAGGEQHVHLPGRRHRRDLVGEVDEVVGGVAHRRDRHDDLVTGLRRLDDALGHPLDAFGVGDR